MTEEKMNKAIELSERLSMLTDVHDALQDEDNLIVDIQRKQYMPAYKFLTPEEKKKVNKLIKGIVSAKLDACKKEFEAL